MARSRRLLSGYESVPGTARRVRTPAGEVISHRQYRNLVVRRAGWRSQAEFETSQGWAKFREKILDANPRADVTYSGRLAADYAKVLRKREAGRKAEGIPGALVQRTSLGRLLVAAGIRDEGEIWGDYL